MVHGIRLERPSALAGWLRSPAALGPSSRWPRRPGCRWSTRTSATRWPRPRRAPAKSSAPLLDSGVAPDHARDRWQRDERRRDRDCSRRSAPIERSRQPAHRRGLPDTTHRPRRGSGPSRPVRPRSASRRGRPPGRLRREQPLLGPTGAAETYGPQKGATPQGRQILEWSLEAWADALEAETGRRERDTPGAGAAGGVGFGLLAIQDRFRSFALRPGVDLVMEATDFDARLARADLVITGEGRIDAQTAFGKTALGVAKRAQAAGKPCIGVGGSVEPDGIDGPGRRRCAGRPRLGDARPARGRPGGRHGATRGLR